MHLKKSTKKEVGRTTSETGIEYNPTGRLLRTWVRERERHLKKNYELSTFQKLPFYKLSISYKCFTFNNRSTFQKLPFYVSCLLVISSLYLII